MDERTRIEEAKKDEMSRDELSREVDKATLAFVRYIFEAPLRKTKTDVRIKVKSKTLEWRMRDLLSARGVYFGKSMEQTKHVLRLMKGKEEAFNRNIKPADLMDAMLRMQLEDYDTRMTDTLVNIVLVSRVFGTSNDLGKMREQNKPLAQFMKRLAKRAKSRSSVPTSTADINRLMWSRWVGRGIL